MTTKTPKTGQLGKAVKRGLAAVGAFAVALVLLAATACAPDGPDAGSAASDDLFDPSQPFYLDDDYSRQEQAAAAVTVDGAQFATDPPYSIAAVVQGSVNGWGRTFDVVLDYTLNESGKVGDFLYHPWDGTSASQIAGIDAAIEADVDGIIITALSRADLAEPVARATAAGIPVVTCMNGVEGDGYTVAISRNIPALGYASARVLAETIGGAGNVLLLHGIEGVDSAVFLRLGALEALGEFDGINILGERNGEWSVPVATGIMRQVVDEFDDIDAIWVGGLEMGESVITVFEEVGRDIPFMAGVNATNGFFRLAIEHGAEFASTPFTPAAAQMCANRLLALLDGESMSKFVDVREDLDIPALITHETAAEFYVPELIDEFTGPMVVPLDSYVAAGLGR